MAPKKNILVFTTWSFKDGLIQAATLPYLRRLQPIAGGEIYLLCWEQSGLALTEREYQEAQAALAKEHIHLLRLPYHKSKPKAALGWGGKMAQLLLLCYRKNIRYFHAFSTPAGSIAYVLSKLRRVQLTVDSMEPHADLMAETGVWPTTSRLYKIAFAMEKKLVRRANKLIAISKSIRPYFKERYGIDPAPGKLFYRPLCVSPELFKPLPADYSLLNWPEKKAGTIAVYTGKLGGMYYDKEFCAFIRACIQFWNGDFHLIFCTAMPLQETTEYLVQQGISPEHFTIRFVLHPHMPQYLALADFGISFSRPSAARQYGCPTKNAEYWSAGLPVVATDAILDDNREVTQNPYLGVVLTAADLAQPQPKLEALQRELSLKKEKGEKIRDYAIRERSFEQAQKVYEAIYGA